MKNSERENDLRSWWQKEANVEIAALYQYNKSNDAKVNKTA